MQGYEPYLLTTSCLQLKKKKKSNACNEAVILLNIYSSACCFNILCDEVESQHGTFSPHLRARRLSRGTTSTYVIELQAELATFPQRTPSA